MNRQDPVHASLIIINVVILAHSHDSKSLEFEISVSENMNVTNIFYKLLTAF